MMPAFCPVAGVNDLRTVFAPRTTYADSDRFCGPAIFNERT